MSNPTDEIEVVCAQCSFPTVTEYDDKGSVLNFREEAGPRDEEEAAAQGWTDHGLGLYCPECSLSYLEELARDEASGAQTGASNDISEIVDAQFLRVVAPEVSDDTVQQFVQMFRSERLNRFRVLAGMESIPLYAPVAKDDTQAEEFIAVAAALNAAKEKKA